MNMNCLCLSPTLEHINRASTFIFQATDECLPISLIWREYSMFPFEAPVFLFAQTLLVQACRGQGNLINGSQSSVWVRCMWKSCWKFSGPSSSVQIQQSILIRMVHRSDPMDMLDPLASYDFWSSAVLQQPKEFLTCMDTCAFPCLGGHWGLWSLRHC